MFHIFYDVHSFLQEQFYKKKGFDFGKTFKNKLRAKPTLLFQHQSIMNPVDIIMNGKISE